MNEWTIVWEAWAPRKKEKSSFTLLFDRLWFLTSSSVSWNHFQVISIHSVLTSSEVIVILCNVFCCSNLLISISQGLTLECTTTFRHRSVVLMRITSLFIKPKDSCSFELINALVEGADRISWSLDRSLSLRHDITQNLNSLDQSHHQATLITEEELCSTARPDEEARTNQHVNLFDFHKVFLGKKWISYIYKEYKDENNNIHLCADRLCYNRNTWMNDSSTDLCLQHQTSFSWPFCTTQLLEANILTLCTMCDK